MAGIAMALAIITLLTISLSTLVACEDCGDKNYFATRLTIENHRSIKNGYENTTGQWITQVEVVHREDDTSGGPWGAVFRSDTECLDPSNKYCEHGTLKLDATLHVPSEGAGAGGRPPVQSPPLLALGPPSPAVLWPTPLSFAEALAACAQEGGELAPPPPAPAAAALAAALARRGLPAAYIGLHRSPADDPGRRFVTLRGLELPEEQLNWAEGHPATEGPLTIDACIVLTKYAELKDIYCSYALPYVCSSLENSPYD